MAVVRSIVPAPGPIGALTLGSTGAGLAAVVFGDHPEAVERMAARVGEPVVDGDGGRAREQLTEYFGGGRRTFDVPLDWSLTRGWQRQVLQTLYETVPFGRTVTYGELASRSGGQGHTAARGVGSIMGSNPLPVVVPCHRVLGSDSLGGFGGGRATKEWLLALEGVLTPALDFGPG